MSIIDGDKLMLESRIKVLEAERDKLLSDNTGLVQDKANDQAAYIHMREQRDKLRDALEKLARLGNGDYYGNSIGNMIARAALGVQE